MDPITNTTPIGDKTDDNATTDAPVADVPATDPVAPVVTPTDTPATDMPATDPVAPVVTPTDTPATDMPVADTPATDMPAV